MIQCAIMGVAMMVGICIKVLKREVDLRKPFGKGVGGGAYIRLITLDLCTD